jgi:hypothetical protein
VSFRQLPSLAPLLFRWVGGAGYQPLKLDDAAPSCSRYVTVKNDRLLRTAKNEVINRQMTNGDKSWLKGDSLSAKRNPSPVKQPYRNVGI